MTAVELETRMLKRIRKRPRSVWDVGPSEYEPEAQRPLVTDDQGTAKQGSPPKRDNDREGHYVYNLGENLTPRCTFGRVLECWDHQGREYVAIKVVRSIRKYRDAAMIEVDVLNHIAKNDNGNSCAVQIRDWFDYHNHICIVFWHLCSQFMSVSCLRTLILNMAQRFSSDEMQYRCLPKSSAIKLIDFGSTVFENQNHSSIVSTRHY